uniref:Uncharacterized protein n=1 Tax=Arundo donax TaxID=35708 RepID=A0A0A9G4D4_ARUDO
MPAISRCTPPAAPACWAPRTRPRIARRTSRGGARWCPGSATRAASPCWRRASSERGSRSRSP